MSEEHPSGPVERVVLRLRDAISYSRNFATAKPNIRPMEQGHIIGLCAMLGEAVDEIERLHAERANSREALPYTGNDCASFRCLVDAFKDACLRAGRSNSGMCIDPMASADWKEMQRLRKILHSMRLIGPTP